MKLTAVLAQAGWRWFRNALTVLEDAARRGS